MTATSDYKPCIQQNTKDEKDEGKDGRRKLYAPESDNDLTVFECRQIYLVLPFRFPVRSKIHYGSIVYSCAIKDPIHNQLIGLS